MAEEQQASVSKPLTITFGDKKELYRSYMPFVKGGAIFIPTMDKNYQKIGLKIFVIMKIKDEKTQNTSNKPFGGQVIWVTTSGPSTGIGISFGDPESSKSIRDFIETYIADVGGKNDLISYTI